VDALVTDDPAVTLVVTAADCAQVLFLDPSRRAVGLAHAGWRGTAAGVLAATVAALGDHSGSDPADLRAAVGPCLGPCCAQFSDPRRELPPWCAPFIHGDKVDLWAMNRHQLLQAGLRAAHVDVAEVCTVCRRDLFYSHRGDKGRTGRFAAAIGQRCARLRALPAAMVVRAARGGVGGVGARGDRAAHGRPAPPSRRADRRYAGVSAAGRPRGARRAPRARAPRPSRARGAGAPPRRAPARGWAACPVPVTLVPATALYLR